MSRVRCLFTAIALLAGAGGLAGVAEAQSPGQCAPNNLPCVCSMDCCGQMRCDSSACNQCVMDCVQRKRVLDDRFNRFKLRCLGPADQKSRRL